MNQRIIVFFIFCLILSCTNKENKENREIKAIDSLKFIQDSTHVTTSFFEVDSEDQRKQDSVDLYKIDSLKRYLNFLRKNQNVTIPKRCKRLTELYRNNLWLNYYDDIKIDIDSLFASEMIFLFKDTMIVNYDIDSILVSIDKNSLYECHSKDNKLWVISWLNSWGGTGNDPVNLFI